MYINEFIKYELGKNNYYPQNFNKNQNIIYLEMFFDEAFPHIRLFETINFIKDINDYPYDRFLFELVELSIDELYGLIYIYESCRTYDSKQKTPEIEELLEEDNFIELCKIGFLDYIIITKDNFIHLLLAWDKVVDIRQSFALLYLDDKDWYDVLSFDSKEAMDKFVTAHTK